MAIPNVPADRIAELHDGVVFKPHITAVGTIPQSQYHNRTQIVRSVVDELKSDSVTWPKTVSFVGLDSTPAFWAQDVFLVVNPNNTFVQQLRPSTRSSSSAIAASLRP